MSDPATSPATSPARRPIPQGRLLKTRDVERRLGIEYRGVMDLVNSGKLAVVRLPSTGKRKRLRYDSKDIERLLVPAIQTVGD